VQFKQGTLSVQHPVYISYANDTSVMNICDIMSREYYQFAACTDLFLCRPIWSDNLYHRRYTREEIKVFI